MAARREIGALVLRVSINGLCQRDSHLVVAFRTTLLSFHPGTDILFLSKEKRKQKWLPASKMRGGLGNGKSSQWMPLEEI